MEERVKLIKGSIPDDIVEKLENCETLMDFFRFSERLKNGTFAQMQLYILENYEKVPMEVWNDEWFKMTPHLGKDELCFGKTDEFKSDWKIKSLQEHAKKRWEKSIKIESIEFTLDPHDGDFSVKFNKHYWTFLWDREVLDYYMTIKNYLKKVEKV